MHKLRLSALIVSGCLCASHASAQAPPSLSRPQRDLLQAIVTAVDGAAAQPETADASLQAHVLRASDGSHYVAFTIAPPAGTPLPSGPALLYVRLDENRQAATTTAARSPIREWLAGMRTAPPPIARSGIALGEMPIMGATGNIERGTSQGRGPTTSGMVDLQLMAMERRRERERQEEAERQRQAELEGSATRSAEIVPFEDFDLASRSVSPRGERVITRALTAGPGDFVLYAAWADPAAAAPASTIRVIKKPLRLPTAPPGELSVSSVIVADRLSIRDTPDPAAEQASHPYAIGVTEITPSADTVFRNDEHVNVVFQVINPRPSDAGKPDVEIASRVVRVTGARTEPVASLKPLLYTASTLPEPFDLRVGHPVLAAMSFALDTLPGGAYRLEILVNDKRAGRTVTADVNLTITSTPASLLKAAPPLAPPFAPESITSKEVRAYLVQSLRPAAPSPALQSALDTAAAGRFVDLIVDQPVGKGEEGTRAVLSGLAQLAVGDGTSAVQFQRAVLLGAPVGPSRLLSGAARALQNRDTDAIAAWQEALKSGAPAAIVAPLLLDAYLRRADIPAAAALVAATKPAPASPAWARGVAAMLIATKKPDEALASLDKHLAANPDDAAAEWLRVHALYALVAGGNASLRGRFETGARAHIAANGPHAAVATEWLAALTP